MTDVKVLLLQSNNWNQLTLWKQIINSKQNFVLDRNTWNHLTVSKKMSSGLFKNITNKSYIWDIYKEDLTFNNLQWLIYHKTQPNQLPSWLGL